MDGPSELPAYDEHVSRLYEYAAALKIVEDDTVQLDSLRVLVSRDHNMLRTIHGCDPRLVCELVVSRFANVDGKAPLKEICTRIVELVSLLSYWRNFAVFNPDPSPELISSSVLLLLRAVLGVRSRSGLHRLHTVGFAEVALTIDALASAQGAGAELALHEILEEVANLWFAWCAFHGVDDSHADCTLSPRYCEDTAQELNVFLLSKMLEVFLRECRDKRCRAAFDLLMDSSIVPLLLHDDKDIFTYTAVHVLPCYVDRMYLEALAGDEQEGLKMYETRLLLMWENVISELWVSVETYVRGETVNSIGLSRAISLCCQLADHFCYRSSPSDPCLVDVASSNELWEKIQQGLLCVADEIIVKRCTYLMKILMKYSDEQLTSGGSCASSCALFSWNPQQRKQWDTFFTIWDTIDQFALHLFRANWGRVMQLIPATAGECSSEHFIHPSWVGILVKKSLHEPRLCREIVATISTVKIDDERFRTEFVSSILPAVILQSLRHAKLIRTREETPNSFSTLLTRCVSSHVLQLLSYAGTDDSTATLKAKNMFRTVIAETLARDSFHSSSMVVFFRMLTDIGCACSRMDCADSVRFLYADDVAELVKLLDPTLPSAVPEWVMARIAAQVLLLIQHLGCVNDSSRDAWTALLVRFFDFVPGSAWTAEGHLKVLARLVFRDVICGGGDDTVDASIGALVAAYLASSVQSPFTGLSRLVVSMYGVCDGSAREWTDRLSGVFVRWQNDVANMSTRPYLPLHVKMNCMRMYSSLASESASLLSPSEDAALLAVVITEPVHSGVLSCCAELLSHVTAVAGSNADTEAAREVTTAIRECVECARRMNAPLDDIQSPADAILTSDAPLTIEGSSESTFLNGKWFAAALLHSMTPTPRTDTHSAVAQIAAECRAQVRGDGSAVRNALLFLREVSTGVLEGTHTVDDAGAFLHNLRAIVLSMLDLCPRAEVSLAMDVMRIVLSCTFRHAMETRSPVSADVWSDIDTVWKCCSDVDRRHQSSLYCRLIDAVLFDGVQYAALLHDADHICGDALRQFAERAVALGENYVRVVYVAAVSLCTVATMVDTAYFGSVFSGVVSTLLWNVPIPQGSTLDYVTIATELEHNASAIGLSRRTLSVAPTLKPLVAAHGCALALLMVHRDRWEVNGDEASRAFLSSIVMGLYECARQMMNRRSNAWYMVRSEQHRQLFRIWQVLVTFVDMFSAEWFVQQQESFFRYLTIGIDPPIRTLVQTFILHFALRGGPIAEKIEEGLSESSGQPQFIVCLLTLAGYTVFHMTCESSLDVLRVQRTCRLIARFLASSHTVIRMTAVVMLKLVFCRATNDATMSSVVSSDLSNLVSDFDKSQHGKDTLDKHAILMHIPYDRYVVHRASHRAQPFVAQVSEKDCTPMHNSVPTAFLQRILDTDTGDYAYLHALYSRNHIINADKLVPRFGDDVLAAGEAAADDWMPATVRVTAPAAEDTESAVAAKETAAGADNFQRKIQPWDEVTDEIAFYDGVRATRIANHGAHTGTRQLIVIASLIDKATNLGGLCRTCEIFQAAKLIVPNMKLTQEKNFTALTVAADRWQPIEEVPPFKLVKYLNDLKEDGYTVVGLEQTSDSEMLGKPEKDAFDWPERTALLLGAEKFGIFPEFLPYVDRTVEIPQLGVTRSLNVHVSAAIAVWEYTKQHMVVFDDE